VLLGQLGHQHQAVGRSIDQGACPSLGVLQSLQAAIEEPATPLAHRPVDQPDRWRHLASRHTSSCQQLHFGTLSVSPRCGLGPHPSLKFVTVIDRQ